MLNNIIHIIYLEVVAGCAMLLCVYALGPAMRRELGNAPVMIALGLPALAFLLPKLWMLHIAMFLVVPMLAKGSAGRVAPLYLLALMMLPPLDQLMMAGSLMLWNYDLNMSLGLGALMTLLSSPGRARSRLSYDIPFVCVFAVLVFAAVRDTSLTNLLRELTQVGLSYAMPYYIVSRSIRSVADIKRIFLALAIGGAVVSAILLFEAVRAWPLYVQLYNHYGLPGETFVKLRSGMLRAFGPFMEATAAGFFMLYCFFAAYFSRDAFRSGTKYWQFVIFVGLGLLPPQSRGAWIGLVLGLLLADLYQRRLGALAKKATIIGILGALLLVSTATNDRVAQLAGVSGHGADTLDYRKKLWERGKEEVRQHPLAGQSYRRLLVEMKDLKQGEQIIDFVNTWLFIALVSGIPGLLLFALGMVGAPRNAWSLRSRLPIPAAAFVFVGTATPLAMLAFTSFSGKPAIILFAVFGIGAALGSKQKLMARQPPAAPRRILAAPKLEMGFPAIAGDPTGTKGHQSHSQ